jgi:hypothetical protein
VKFSKIQGKTVITQKNELLSMQFFLNKAKDLLFLLIEKRLIKRSSKPSQGQASIEAYSRGIRILSAFALARLHIEASTLILVMTDEHGHGRILVIENFYISFLPIFQDMSIGPFLFVLVCG